MHERHSHPHRWRRWLLPLLFSSIGIIVGLLGRPYLERRQPVVPPDMHTLAEVIAEVRDNYVEPRTEAQLLDDAIAGAMSSLDEHSEFLDEDALMSLTQQTTGHFGGIGVEVTLDDGAFRIIAPIDDTPAQRAGLYAGDELISIDDAPVEGRTLDQITSALRGEPGTQVQLAVRRDGTNFDFLIRRAIIDVDSVRSHIVEPGYAYVRISQFQADTGAELVHTLNDLQTRNGALQGIVLDLRNNPGGVLQASVEVADAFLTEADGLIVSTHGRHQSLDLRYRASGADLLHGAPIVVLINKGSASAAEIVAGALQDHRRALLLGSTSYGKGSVQAVLALDHQRALKLTTALYFTPSGRSIQGTGIHPDVELDADAGDAAASQAVLAQALRELKQLHRG